MGHDVANQVERSSARNHTRALEHSPFRLHRWVRLGQTSHLLLAAFDDDAEGRSHDGVDANAPMIEINLKKPLIVTGHR
jgi:hypothetical protein